jgi:glycosyltransferase involved in cell wall biosynthesis
MRIIVLLPSMRGGGAERVTSLLASAWASNGHDVHLATFASEALDAYSLPATVTRIAFDLEQPARSMFDALTNNARRIVALRRLFAKVRPHAVIGMMPTCSVLARIAAGRSGVRVIAAERIHPPTVPISLMWAIMRRIVYPRTAVVVVQTDKAARWIEHHCAGSSVAVIPNPILWPLPRQGGSTASAVPALRGRSIVLAVGRLERQKGFDLLIDAFSQVAGSHPSWDLVIVGEGTERDALSLQVKSTRLNDRIRLPGYVADIQPWYEAAGLFVLSSRFEGFPNSLAEAMASGCPVVSFDCETGPSELIEHGTNGLLVPTTSGAAGLEAAMSELLDDPQRRRSLGAIARGVRVRLELSRIAAIWEQLLLDLCDMAQQP